MVRLGQARKGWGKRMPKGHSMIQENTIQKMGGCNRYKLRGLQWELVTQRGWCVGRKGGHMFFHRWSNRRWEKVPSEGGWPQKKKRRYTCKEYQKKQVKGGEGQDIGNWIGVSLGGGRKGKYCKESPSSEGSAKKIQEEVYQLKRSLAGRLGWSLWGATKRARGNGGIAKKRARLLWSKWTFWWTFGLNG